MNGYCHQCHHAWLAHDDGTDDGDHCRACPYDGFVPDFTDEELADLQADLDELERTDPDVRAAAQSYDRMVARVTGQIAVAFDVPSVLVGLPDDGRRPDPLDECTCGEAWSGHPNPHASTCPNYSADGDPL